MSKNLQIGWVAKWFEEIKYLEMVKWFQEKKSEQSYAKKHIKTVCAAK